MLPVTGLEGFAGRMPLLPLANTVVLPGGLLSARLFEERSFRLVRDAIRADRLVALGHLRDGWELRQHARPSVHPVVGVSRILASEDLPSGRIAVLFCGAGRGLVTQEGSGGEGAYRAVRVRLLRERRACSRLVERFARRAVLRAFRDLLEFEPQNLLVWDRYRLADAPLSLLSDHLASNLVLDPRVKQSLLEETDVVRRATRLAKAIRMLLFAVRSRARSPLEVPLHTSRN